MSERVFGNDREFNEKAVWDVADEVTTKLKLRARSEVMKPLRHAITGRSVSLLYPQLVSIESTLLMLDD